MAGSIVHPALGLGVALGAVSAKKRGLLAEPATNEDVEEVIWASGSENLSEGSGVEDVVHLTWGSLKARQIILLEGSVLSEGGLAHDATILVDNGHVASAGS